MLKRVLLLSASAGAGHIRAAQAIEKAFAEIGAETGAQREVHHFDILNYTNKIFRHLYSKAYIDLVNKMPEVPGWFYDKLDKPWKNERRRLALDKLNTRPLVKLLREQQPDLIVCTHFLPAEIVSWLKAKERLSSRQVIIVTDFDVHAMWLVHHYEHYFVALEEARVYLEALGIPPEKITVSGIPIDPIFARQKDKQEMRAKHGLAADRLTILLSAGGFGVGSVDALIAALMPLQHRAQIVAICGRNEELLQRL
jgi:processive 1,2-diacylglycerol beta-glucosyltransferase